MNSASVTDILGAIMNNNLSRQVLLAGLIVSLTVLLFHKLILAPELKSIKQLKSQMLQIENSLIQVNAANNNSKKPNLVQFMEKREIPWKSCFQFSGSMPNCYADSLTQFRKKG